MERKYRLSRNGWDVQDASNKSSTIRKGIISVKRLFMENIKYHIGLGERIIFWIDRWVGDRSLATQFPDLFKCVVDKEANVNAYTSRVGRHVVWNPT